MPPRNKKSATPSDKRHDNGLIAPGKKVVKDKQSPQPNGNASSKPAAALSVEDPSKTANSTSEDDVDNRPDNYTMAKPIKSAANGVKHRSSDTQAAPAAGDADDDADSFALGASATAANGWPSKHDSTSTAGVLTTVIGLHSHWDVLAILLLLLQLPPILLILVQSSFAFMTFGNTANTWSMFTLSSAQDWFRSHGGNPSAVVSLLADIIITCLWLLSPILKDFFLDLAPAVVALSLGGGTAAKSSWKHAAICMTTVFIGHIFQERRRRQYFLNLIWTCMAKLSLSHLRFVPLAQVLVPKSPRAARSWARIILELHIVTHGFVRVIRRWIDRSSQASNSRNSVKGETESAAASQILPASGTADVVSESVRNASNDSRPPGPSPLNRDKVALPSGKKRRKQATLVRSQQPFWAAIATTKIQVSKEIEQSHAERDNFEADATSINNVGNANAKSLDDRVWITRVDDTEIWFAATLLKDDEISQDADSQSGASSRRDSLESIIINVHVNGAYWSSVDSQILGDGGDAAPDGNWDMGGKIFGLTASTNYLVKFVRLSEDKVIYASTLLTRPAASLGQVSSVPAQPQDPLRPSSPTTTLKKSIEAADSKLADHKNRSNKARRGRQNATRNVKQEFSELSRIVSSCGTNERQHQRQLQYGQNIKQAEESVVELASQIATLGDVPRTDASVFEGSKSKWTDAVGQRDALRKELDASKKEGQRKANESYSEIAKVRGKREKAEGRLASLMDRYKATGEENDAKRNAMTHSETQHAYKIEHFRHMERNLVREAQMWESQRQDFDTKAIQLEQQKHYFEGTFARPLNGQHAIPLTPESSNAGLASGFRAPFATNTFNHHTYPIGTPSAGIRSRQNSVRQRTRARSSSMLSNISGFTDEELTPHAVEDTFANRDIARNGSGSPRNGGFSSPQRLSPIGTEVGRGSPRQRKR